MPSLTEQAWSIKYLPYGQKRVLFSLAGPTRKIASGQDRPIFSCSGSQPESMICFILPACGFSHIIIENNITDLFHILPWYPQDPLRFQLMRLLRNSSPIRRFLLCCQKKEQQEEGKKTNKCLDHQPYHSPLMQEKGFIALLITPLSCKKKDS